MVLEPSSEHVLRLKWLVSQVEREMKQLKEKSYA